MDHMLFQFATCYWCVHPYALTALQAEDETSVTILQLINPCVLLRVADVVM